MRQVVLDTETTGLEPSQGHRIIEIGCVELIDRKLTGRHYHQYINPNRDIDAGAIEVHGITNEFLADKPRFQQIVKDFVEFIDGAELVIHNAPFDIGFIDAEFSLLGAASPGKTIDYCTVVDTLVMARQKHPGQRNSLDALCSRYEVDNSQRDLHGALLDSEILADVYLLMTGGQSNLLLSGDDNQEGGGEADTAIRRLAADRPTLKVVRASAEELAAHELRLEEIDKASDGNTQWR
ncbi:DNA polymerase III subunit epsilon [Oceanicoccus sp. KOV_DT_Chl]|uniref:DNA polymerase III subunit epsilon n=1 Tax=Oceanicoccus sp. KOV_DT_Chl TaxID=1904639 RepID=UPI000C7D1DB5|nr:DNA polymerase III subunit epsilon [Oceanicoccus sp. KOV_DT_Chl]